MISIMCPAGFDARHNSKAYARLAAAVFASAGVKVGSSSAGVSWGGKLG